MNVEPYTGLPVHLASGDIVHPLAFIKRFFTQEVHFPDARKFLTLWLRAAFDDKMILSKKQMVMLMGFQELFMPLVEGAYILYQADENVLAETIISDESTPNFMDEQYYYIDPHKLYSPWLFFPRHLNRKEYMNPCKVLEKFFLRKSLPDWQHFLVDIFSAAVSKCNIFGCTSEKNIWVTCLYLFKLLEATHLIKIRSEQKS